MVHMKRENGITLIALVITIIVLLILAGVALATLTGQGNIIENSENAVGKYNNSVIEEQELLNTIEQYFENYLGGNGGTIVDKTEIANNPSEHYGGEVTNYTTPSGDPNVKWRIFYADESNIYLIASDYIHYDYAPTSANYTLYKNSDYQLLFDDVYKDYTGSASITDTRIRKWIQKYLDVAPTSTNTNIRAVTFMLDETRWSAKYANPSYAEYAIGGPTLEMFVASYNKTHPEKPMYCSVNSTGYYISWSEEGTDTYISGVEDDNELYYITNLDKCDYMWIGSPSANSDLNLVLVYYTGYVSLYHFDSNRTTGFRPLVCLNSDIQLEKQSNGTYLIK